ncbi:MAG: thiamine pyrophosphate-dependent enzyme, partial [Myxococcota bacterium]|nr:thiamine pyrophosphate-dependent enzyme [Myxococcota bacterium]
MMETETVSANGKKKPTPKKKTPAKKGSRRKSVVETLLPTHQPSSGDAQHFIRQRTQGDTAGLNPAQLGELYQFLFETRRLEEHLVALFRQNKVIGGVYRSLGQEGTAVGCGYALKNGDFLQPLIRDMGSMLVHGVTPLALLRQYMAKATGPSGGRDLNQHFSNPDAGILG